MFEGTPSGTVTRGQLLVGDADALVARSDTSLINGVALSDSADTINGKITFCIPGADQAFWADVASDATFAAGDEVVFNHTGGDHTAVAVGLGTAEARVLKGVSDVNQIAGATKRILVQIYPAIKTFGGAAVDVA